MIAERQYMVADDLPGLVAFAGDQERVARLQGLDRDPDRGSAIADVLGSFGSAQDRGTDRVRIFAAGIVIGDDDIVGILRRDRAHQRTLAGITVTAGAEYHNEPAPGVRPQRLQCFCQRVGLVRVVDEDRRAVALADALQAALCAFELFECREHRTGLAAGTDRKSGRNQRVLDLEFTDRRTADRYLSARM